MHEISLVRTVFRTLEEEFSAEELENLMAVDLKVGLLSNVEPVLMQSAFSAVKETDNRYKTVELNIELVPIEIFCDDCQKPSSVEQYKFVCAHCAKPNNNITKGTELLIHQVHFSETG